MLLDEHMPGLSGHDVQARVRRMPALGAMPIVLMTGDLASPGHGAVAVLTKPIDAPCLFDAVEKYAHCPAAAPPAAPERVRRGPRQAAALHRHIEATLDELRARLDAARSLRDEQMRIAVRWGLEPLSPRRHGNG
jgi:CheY-like chemotaxis protein